MNCRPGREEEVLRRPKTIVSDVQQDQPDGEHGSQQNNAKNKQITEWKHNAKWLLNFRGWFFVDLVFRFFWFSVYFFLFFGGFL